MPALLSWLLSHPPLSHCLVQEPGYAGGDRQCFGTDELGMVCFPLCRWSGADQSCLQVCGWDGEKDSEAYCEKGSRGLMVCARKRGGGKCQEPHGNTPFTEKEHDVEPR